MAVLVADLGLRDTIWGKAQRVSFLPADIIFSKGCCSRANAHYWLGAL